MGLAAFDTNLLTFVPPEGGPHVLKKIVFAGAQHPSFAQGSAALAALAGLTIATKQVERVTEKIGRERVDREGKRISIRIRGRELHDQGIAKDD